MLRVYLRWQCAHPEFYPTAFASSNRRLLKDMCTFCFPYWAFKFEKCIPESYSPPFASSEHRVPKEIHTFCFHTEGLPMVEECTPGILFTPFASSNHKFPQWTTHYAFHTESLFESKSVRRQFYSLSCASSSHRSLDPYILRSMLRVYLRLKSESPQFISPHSHPQVMDFPRNPYILVLYWGSSECRKVLTRNCTHLHSQPPIYHCLTRKSYILLSILRFYSSSKSACPEWYSPAFASSNPGFLLRTHTFRLHAEGSFKVEKCAPAILLTPCSHPQVIDFSRKPIHCAFHAECLLGSKSVHPEYYSPHSHPQIIDFQRNPYI